MFCTVKQNKNKYAVYLSERVREDGRVKSKDKYIFSLKAEEIEDKAYINRVQYTSLSDEEKQLVINKLDNMEISLHATTNNIPLQDTTKEKPLHTTTRVDIVGQVEYQVLEYQFFINDILVVKFDSLDFENARISIISKMFKNECEEHGFNSDNKEIDRLYDVILDLWNYYRHQKEKIEQAKIEAASYYENTIMGLKLKIMELESSSGSIKHTTTTDQTRVKKIYRALANKLHPDNGGSDELMQMLNELKDMIN